jgi:hypothetical protein
MVNKKFIVCAAILVSKLFEMCIVLLLFLFLINFFFGFFKYAPVENIAYPLIFFRVLVDIILYIGSLAIIIYYIKKLVRDLRNWDQGKIYKRPEA